MTESLRLQGEHKYLTKAWTDVLSYKPDNRTGDEVAAAVMQAAGLRFATEGGDADECI